MSDEDLMGDVVERLEWDERKEPDSPFKRAKQVTRRTALTGGAAGVIALALQACGSSGSSKSNTSKAATTSSGSGGSAAASIFGDSTKYKFTMVNHVTTNTFFTPTINGMADVAKLLGIPNPQWTGSQTSNVGEMVNSFNAAMTSGVDGIGIALIDAHAFNKPVATAISKGIPVISYNADEPNARLAYVGQDLYLAGQEMGQHILSLGVTGDVAIFIATPGAANIQPRMDGAMQVLKSHSNIHAKSITTGAAVPAELSAISSYVSGHPSTKGLFAVDGGSTQGIAQVIRKQNLRSKGVKGGGFDLTPVTETLLQAGDLDFTIDQQPYLQGFLPILEMYLYKVSKGLTGPADVNTGLKFVTKSTVGPYANTKSRFEGTSSSPGVQKA